MKFMENSTQVFMKTSREFIENSVKTKEEVYGKLSKSFY
jgi:hypothetical protein